MKKKILLVTGIYPPDIGGPAQFTFSFANWLKKKGYAVTIITLTNNENIKKKGNFFYISRKKFYVFRLLETIRLILRLKKKFDVVLASGLHFECSLASFFIRKNFFFRVAGDKAWEYSIEKKITKINFDDYQVSNNIKFYFYKSIRNFYLKRCHAIIVPSKYLLNVVRQWKLKKNIYHINNASLISKNKKNIVIRKKIILTVSRLVSWKNIDKSILLIKNLPNYYYYIIGNGPLYGKLKALIIKEGLGKKVFLLGKKNHKIISKYLSQSSAFLLLSSYEGMSHVILDAMQLKVPLLISDILPNRELVINRKNGLLLDINNAKQMQKQIDYFLNNKVKINAQVQKAYEKLKKNYDLEKNFLEYEAVIFK